ncbi:glycosyltransferase family 4 protein [Pleomorphovibrio marinus]|uniref:glycosyltransferase family 4 protein n=1 Tax=Pleomorphovibrio marinus TaxID=2164132 RepID=UPI000E0C2751|nr:glycosyltransferase family 4 protein [Pleomorphovibrio marinus]
MERLPLLSSNSTNRIKIAFFDYPDVFEDFYTHYSISQTTFADWDNTANHAWLTIIQEKIGDVTWYMNVIKPETSEIVHTKVGCKIRFIKSSLLHRMLWRLFYLPSFAWRWQRFYRFYATIASYLSPFSYQLSRRLFLEKPDVIFVQDYCSGRYDVLLFYAYLLNIPLITFHSGSVSYRYLGKRIKKYSISKADYIFSSGTQETGNLINNYKVPPENTAVIRPPINMNVYQIMEKNLACKKLGIDPTRRYLLFVGRFEDGVKRITHMIHVFQKVSEKFQDVDFILIGSGLDEHLIKSRANSLIPGRVFFTGWLKEDSQKALYYNVAECLWLASWREAAPAVIGESFACGTPVLSSRVGGIPDLVIPNKTGWLFEPGDDIEMLETLCTMLEICPRNAEFRENIRNYAENLVSFRAIGEVLKSGFLSVFDPKTN